LKRAAGGDTLGPARPPAASIPFPRADTRPVFQVYLPIAEMSVNALLVLGLGGIVGLLSGMFGVGGGFLMTPLLIFIGIPPAVAVGTQANQIVGASVSGVLGHWRRKNVDAKLGLVMMGGGAFGAVLGVLIFSWLSSLGQVDLVISLLYVFLLGSVGLSMLIESIRTMLQTHAAEAPVRRKLHQHNLLHGLPWKMRFPKSRLYISAWLPIAIGAFGGVLVSIMGIGGGFLLVPAMIYLLGMPAALVAGTSLFQIIFTTAIATLLHAVTTQTVDIMLAGLLILGSAAGAQFGTVAASKLRGEQARGLMSVLVLIIAIRLAFDLFTPPVDDFSVTTLGEET
jgi:uncharacterized membrane protein YfcA